MVEIFTSTIFCTFLQKSRMRNTKFTGKINYVKIDANLKNVFYTWHFAAWEKLLNLIWTDLFHVL